MDTSTECADVTSTSNHVSNGYSRERQDYDKGCYPYVDNSPPQTPNDLSFTSKNHASKSQSANLTDGKPYKCLQCGKAFANNSYLNQHNRIHSGIRPYSCSICGRKFIQLSHLQQHNRTHTGQKPYKCQICLKAFGQMSNLLTHSRTHQKHKPYKCQSCHKCFDDLEELQMHIPKHKQSNYLKINVCQQCGKSYTHNINLEKHMKRHLLKTSKRSPSIDSTPVLFETPHYWPKVSPNTTNNLSQPRDEQEINCSQNNQVPVPSEHVSDEYGSRQPSPTSSGSPANFLPEPIITESLPADIRIQPFSASVFTPVHQPMGFSSHPAYHNHPYHYFNHQYSTIPDRGYLSYNAISFPTTKFPISSNEFSGLDDSTSNTMNTSKTASHVIDPYRPPYNRAFHPSIYKENI